MMLSLIIFFFSSLALAADYDVNELTTASQANVQSCVASVASQVRPPEPVNTPFNQWVTSTFSMPACTITAPATYSDDFLSYDKALSTWLSTVQSVADKINTNCGYDTLSFSFSNYCPTSRTVLFTRAQTMGTTTSLETISTTLPPYQTHDTIYIGAAGRRADNSRFLPVVVLSTTIMALFL
jgi:hypothetical protein